jgi:hypothetical protein
VRSLLCLQRMPSTLYPRLGLLLALGSLAALTGPPAAAAPSVAAFHAGPALVQWTPSGEFDRIVLALADPQGVVRTFQFRAGEAPALSLFDDRGAALPDGTYTWELRATPRLGRTATPLVQSGIFTLSQGHLVAPDLTEPPEASRRPSAPRKLGTTTEADQIVPDDLIIDGKGCIGLGCANNEAFGQEALRLKQSVVRLRFQDTSNVANFPTHDWQLTVNDAGSGGADRFSIEDLTTGTTPVTVRGGAPSNALYVDGLGNIGAGTATPAQDLHIASGSTPTIRLEQTGGTVRTWDLGASDASFFVRDVSNGAAIPFRINAGAPAGSLAVAANGDVGIGTVSPVERLHVVENADTPTFITVENPNAGPNAVGVLRAQSNTAIVNFQAHGSGRTLTRFGEPLASWAEFLQVTGNGLIIGTFLPQPLILGTGAVDRLHITPTGEIGIGTKIPNSKLHVSGGDIRVSGGGFIDDGVTLNTPDYVFEPDYRLMPLTELKAFVTREKRLPNVPGAGEIKQRGLDLSQFQMRLLEKVEELTLYALEQHEEIAALQEKNARLEARLEAVEAVPQQTGQRER